MGCFTVCGTAELKDTHDAWLSEREKNAVSVIAGERKENRAVDGICLVHGGFVGGTGFIGELPCHCGLIDGFVKLSAKALI